MLVFNCANSGDPDDMFDPQIEFIIFGSRPVCFAYRFGSSITVLHQSRTNPHKDMERHRIISVDWIEDRRLRIESHISSQSDLPILAVHPIADRGEGVGANTVRWMSWVLGKQFIFIQQFEASVSVVPRQKVQGRFEQIAVLGSVVQFLVLASPRSTNLPSCRSPAFRLATTDCTRARPTARSSLLGSSASGCCRNPMLY